MKFPIERQDLLWCGGLIVFAAGCMPLWLAGMTRIHQAVPAWLFTSFGFVLGTCCYAAFGAGIGALFQRKLMGATIVMVVALLVTLLTSLPGR